MPTNGHYHKIRDEKMPPLAFYMIILSVIFLLAFFVLFFVLLINYTWKVLSVLVILNILLFSYFWIRNKR
jgi:hypothetical protein